MRRNELADTVEAVSLLADTLIGHALSWLYREACEREGEPTGNESGAKQQLVVLALGKLGAQELNLSSDVDLIFSYPEEGKTSKSGKPNQGFFLRLCQKLIAMLDDVTSEGFVFRVDMRLRPYGDSGALVLNFRSMELYYSQQGRGWERYAWIKARVCAGDREGGRELLAILRPFVYRRYLDFGAIQSLRDMKARVRRERRQEQMKHDIKLGSGGIRDIEFIVQVFQLIFGGQEPELRDANLLRVLNSLVHLGHLDRKDAEELRSAYCFLRNSEHAIQGCRDEQTQRLPENALDQLRLAWVMDCEDYIDFQKRLTDHCEAVSRQFEALIASPQHTTQENRWRELWLQNDDMALAHTLLTQWESQLTKRKNSEFDGSSAMKAIVDALTATRAVCDRSWVGKQSRQRLDEIMPRLLEQSLTSIDPSRVVVRVLKIFQSVIRRSSYLALLIENPHALKELISLCESSAFVADELSSYPPLLDELLDARQLYTLRSHEEVAQELRGNLSVFDESDMEGAMDALRDFKHQQEFRIAVWEVQGTLPLMQISDQLTALAEVILEQALTRAWSATTPQFEPIGIPSALVDGPPAVAIIGYGKLGGFELGPGSDLDLVLLHDVNPESFSGAATQLLHRFAKRLLNMLGATTRAGVLYEVDVRLRPSGRSGAIISSLEGFRRYQMQDAWTWEQQALVRARPVAGNPRLAAAFESVRREVLMQARDRNELRRDVVAMRQRIEQSANAPEDLKKAAGGIVDIEFMVQYLVLAWAHQYPALCRYTDNVRILQIAAAEDLISSENAGRLVKAYLELRSEIHRSILDQPDAQRARQLLQEHSGAVRKCWNELFPE